MEQATKRFSSKFIFNLPHFLKEKLNTEAGLTLLTKGDIIRRALIKYFEDKEKENNNVE